MQTKPCSHGTFCGAACEARQHAHVPRIQRTLPRPRPSADRAGRACWRRSASAAARPAAAARCSLSAACALTLARSASHSASSPASSSSFCALSAWPPTAASGQRELPGAYPKPSPSAQLHLAVHQLLPPGANPYPNPSAQLHLAVHQLLPPGANPCPNPSAQLHLAVHQLPQLRAGDFATRQRTFPGRYEYTRFSACADKSMHASSPCAKADRPLN